MPWFPCRVQIIPSLLISAALLIDLDDQKLDKKMENSKDCYSEVKLNLQNEFVLISS